MSGELFSQGYNDIDFDSIDQDILDVNQDGILDGVELDLAQSVSLMNSLDSIDPKIKKMFLSHDYKLQSGDYLTQKQLQKKEHIMGVINKYLSEDSEADKVQRRFDTDQGIGEIIKPLDGDLKHDLESRTYLEQTEINNQV